MKISSLFMLITGIIMSSGAYAHSGHGHGHDHGSNDNKKDLRALVYQGQDLSGHSCNLYISGYEDHGQLRILTKVKYRIHGVTPMDMQPEFYSFDLETNTYSDPASGEGSPALAALVLRDDSVEADINRLEEYMDAYELLQFMRLDFFDMNIEEFQAGLGSVLADNKNLASEMKGLDQLEQAILVIFHHDHYDAGFCTNFRLKDHMHTATFDLDAEMDDDHDHDHGHGHSHGHSHDHH